MSIKIEFCALLKLRGAILSVSLLTNLNATLLNNIIRLLKTPTSTSSQVLTCSSPAFVRSMLYLVNI